MNSMLANLGERKSVCNSSVLEPSMIDIEINGKRLRGLLDTGASECFMTPTLAKELNLKVNKNFRGSVSLAARS